MCCFQLVYYLYKIYCKFGIYLLINWLTAALINKIVGIPQKHVGYFMAKIYFTVRLIDVPTLPVIITCTITIAMGSNSSCSYFVLRPFQSMRWAAACPGPGSSSTLWDPTPYAVLLAWVLATLFPKLCRFHTQNKNSDQYRRGIGSKILNDITCKIDHLQVEILRNR